MRPFEIAVPLMVISVITGVIGVSARTLATTPAREIVAQNNTSTIELSALEKEIVEEMNRVRSNPNAYADELAAMRQYYDGNLLKLPERIAIETQEGVAALDDAISFLRGSSPLPPLSVSSGMSLAARDHVQDQGARGSIGHTGSDGSRLGDRLARYGSAESRLAENIAYGSPSAADVVRNLIIDDGVRDRGHRVNIFTPYFKYTGVSCGDHANYGSMCVITYAQEYSENLAQQAQAINTPETTTPETETEAITPETPTPEIESEATTPETPTPETESEATTPETPTPETEAEATTPETPTPETEAEATTPEIEVEATPETPTVTEENATPEASNPPTTTNQENSTPLVPPRLASALPFVEKGTLEDGDNKLPQDGSFYDEYHFQGNAGQSVTIDLESSDFDTFLVVLDANNRTIQENDDLTEGNTNSRINITLNQSGTYKVIVNSYDAKGNGSYTLSITN